MFENYQRLKGGRLPPFCNDLITRGTLSDLNREILTYVYSEGVLEHNVYFHSRTLPSALIDGAFCFSRLSPWPCFNSRSLFLEAFGPRVTGAFFLVPKKLTLLLI